MLPERQPSDPPFPLCTVTAFFSHHGDATFQRSKLQRSWIKAVFHTLLGKHRDFLNFNPKAVINTNIPSSDINEPFEDRALGLVYLYDKRSSEQGGIKLQSLKGDPET